MLNLSKQEQQVILFLATVALVGIGINFLIKNFSSNEVIACLKRDFSKIDLNQADRPMLMSVRGIGEKIAQRIIDYRNRQGRFSEVEELMRIRGITAAKYEKIKDAFAIR